MAGVIGLGIFVLGVASFTIQAENTRASCGVEYHRVSSMLRCHQIYVSGGEDMLTCIQRDCRERQRVHEQRELHISVCRQSCSAYFQEDSTSSRVSEDILVHVPNSCKDWCQSDSARTTGYEFRSITAVRNIRTNAHQRHMAHQTL